MFYKAFSKLHLFFLILSLYLPIRGFSQEKNIHKSNSDVYGIKAGINFAELLGNDAIPESDRKEGYSFGVFATYKLTEKLKIQPEIIWSLQGEKSKENGRYKISYINIPLMLKWSENKFYYELGPQLGILTINTSKSVPESIRLENFETFDFSVNVGLGYKLYNDWAIGLRYCHGLTNIVNGRDLKNSVIYLGISYNIF